MLKGKLVVDGSGFDWCMIDKRESTEVNRAPEVDVNM